MGVNQTTKVSRVKEQLYRLYDAKSGVYTVAVPLHIGALTASHPTTT